VLDPRLAPRIAVWVILTACLMAGPAGAGPVAPRPLARSAIPPRGLTVLLTGDSVPLHIADVLGNVLKDKLGWHLVSAAVPNCSIHGDPLAWPNGEPKDNPERCPGIVAPLQASLVQQHDPDFVIWWDRLSTMPFLTEGGDFVQSGSARFWEHRAIRFQDTIARLRAGGARIVFVATEPIGIAFKERCAGSTKLGCVWNRFRLRHYSNVTQPLNRIMRQYAAAAPAEAVFISITDTICRWNVSPCNDRMWNGRLARPDATHYLGRGELRASRAIVYDMRTALYG
jgi:SGNH domain (fused to AT3 domains)